MIIPVFNDEKNLAACLGSIFACDYGKPFEVVIYDDCSTDGSAKVAEGFGCRVVKSDVNRGPGVGRNLAAKEAKGDVFAFTDSDCVVPKDYLSVIDDIFSDPKILAAAGKYSVSLNPQFVSKYRMYESSFHIFRERVFVNHSSSNNLLCCKDTFFKSGGFGDRRIAEDMVFGGNLYKIGVDILLVPELTVSHFCKTKISEYLKQQYTWLKNILEVNIKHPETLKFKWPTKRGPLIYQLAVQMIMLPCFFLLPFKPVPSVIALAAGVILLCLMNLKFLLYVLKGEKYSPAAFIKTFLITFMRNYAWIAGAIAGVGSIKNGIIFFELALSKNKQEAGA